MKDERRVPQLNRQRIGHHFPMIRLKAFHAVHQPIWESFVTKINVARSSVAYGVICEMPARKQGFVKYLNGLALVFHKIFFKSFFKGAQYID